MSIPNAMSLIIAWRTICSGCFQSLLIFHVFRVWYNRQGVRTPIFGWLRVLSLLLWLQTRVIFSVSRRVGPAPQTSLESLPLALVFPVGGREECVFSSSQMTITKCRFGRLGLTTVQIRTQFERTVEFSCQTHVSWAVNRLKDGVR